MIAAFKEKSGKREYALIAMITILWLIHKAATADADPNQALATFKAASPFLTGLVAWGTGWKAYEQIVKARG